jgi:hypothetical protein
MIERCDDDDARETDGEKTAQHVYRMECSRRRTNAKGTVIREATEANEGEEECR